MNKPNTQSMLPQDSLKDKNVIVTGGGSGLGKSMSRYFLQLGANVVIKQQKNWVVSIIVRDVFL